ncbi:MAG: single-stranded DNA-binding protein, partial [Candidatus Gastranaerophilales bacterium]|nr:single-stranded DNA-binding protein [Candidatus Gastranaerophilales bacterium]
MTLAKAVVSGTVYRAPEKRFTQNDVAVYGMTINIDEREETLVRVISKRKFLSEVLDNIKKGDRIIVDGRLQVGLSKTADGLERRYFEIDANDIEILSGSGAAVSSSSGGSAKTGDTEVKTEKDNLVTFSETDYSEDALIDDEEIPFYMKL